MTLQMNVLIAILVTCQITAPTNKPAAYCVADLQAQRQHGGYGGGLDCQYQIQPYLQVAHDLQALNERQRVDQLLEWASIDSLAEPTIILTRLLIEKSNGTPLRRPHLGEPDFQLPGGVGDYPEEPLVFFEDIPFFVVSGYTLHGEPEPAIDYVRYALREGRWRETKYNVVQEDKLRRIAAELIAKYGDSVHDKQWLERWVDSQLGPPAPKNTITKR